MSKKKHRLRKKNVLKTLLDFRRAFNIEDGVLTEYKIFIKKKKYGDKTSRRSIRRGAARKRGMQIHHIVPKCFGGANKVKNIVALWPDEHAYAHRLLTDCFIKAGRDKLAKKNGNWPFFRILKEYFVRTSMRTGYYLEYAND